MKQLLIAVACIGLLMPAVHVRGGEIDRTLEDVFAQTGDDEVVSALLFLWDQGDIDALAAEHDAQRAPRAFRHEQVVRTLRDTAEVTQMRLRDELAQMHGRGEVERIEPFWIANCIRVDATPDRLRAIAEHPDVMRVYFNPPIESVAPVQQGNAGRGDGGGATTGGPEVGVMAVRAPEVWADGYTGEGVIVASLDTGVDATHPALADRWRGNDPAYVDNPEWAWFDPVTNTTFPQEFDSFSSHGTHTMGTICGGAPGDQVGVAPGAQWIHAAVIDRVNVETTVADALASFQWMVNPTGNPADHWAVPDVCSNSWGLLGQHGYPACDQTFWSFIDNAEAAGIVVLFAAGNEGSSGLRRPADRATDEYRNVAVAAVNAHEPGWPVASFSAKGPTFCTIDGSPATKPDIAAPGVEVRSAVKDNDYKSYQGTSMAVPHVAGVVALIRQACPNLTPSQIKQIIYDTAHDLGPSGKNNETGWGMVDAYEALLAVKLACPIIIELPDGAPAFVDPGVQTPFAVRIKPEHEQVQPGTESLFYRFDDGPYQSVPLNHVGGDDYIATLPAGSCGQFPEFYIEAESETGIVVRHPTDAPDVVHQASVGELVFYFPVDETFDASLPDGWSMSGLWNLTSQCAIAGNCPTQQWAYYGIPDTCSYDTPGEPNSGAMITAPIDIPDLPLGGEITISFCYTLETEGSTTYDVATFSILGGDSVQLDESPQWTTFSHDITQHAGETIVLQWHFDTIDSWLNDFHGWQIDKVRITVARLECDDAPVCLGDLNGDGVVDVSDLLVLLGAWGECPAAAACPADLNGDGVVDVSDLLILLGAWGDCD